MTAQALRQQHARLDAIVPRVNPRRTTTTCTLIFPDTSWRTWQLPKPDLHTSYEVQRGWLTWVCLPEGQTMCSSHCCEKAGQLSRISAPVAGRCFVDLFSDSLCYRILMCFIDHCDCRVVVCYMRLRTVICKQCCDNKRKKRTKHAANNLPH